jgi:hypothetical protein
VVPKFFLNSCSGGWNLYWVHSARLPLLAYCTFPGWLWGWRTWCNKDWQGKPKYSERTCPSATLSTTNPTWSDSVANPGHRGGKPATNCLNYGAATWRLQLVASLPPERLAFESQVMSCGICGGLSDTEDGFLRVFLFPADSHSSNCCTFITQPVISILHSLDNGSIVK